MPKILEYQGYKFFFFSNEGNPLEPMHIHIRKGGKLAKFWLEPEICLESSFDFNSSELSFIRNIVFQNKDLFRRKWYEFFEI